MGTVVMFLRRASSAHVHREQIITAQLVPFTAQRLQKLGPMRNGDASALLPLLHSSAILADIRGHVGQRVPSSKHVIKRMHDREYASDELSAQAPAMIPMTNIYPVRTISPMGRSTTPVKFRAEMAKRLMSARIVAGYATKRAAAQKLGITLDRYEKWEVGRTPVPAQYVGPICDLFHIDANYLFGVERPPVTPRKTG